MIFPLETIQDAISKVRGTTNKGKDVEIHGMLCFRDGKVSTFDGLSGSITSCDLGGLEFLVDAAKLSGILGQMEGSQFELEQTDGWITIRSGNYHSRLATLPTFDFPDILPTDSTIYCNATNLAEALKAVSFTVEKDDTKEIAGVGFRGSCVYSLDGKRLTRADLNGSVSSPLVIGKRAADLIARMGTPSYLFRAGTNLGALYKEDKLIFVTRQLQTQMPFDHLDAAFAKEPAVTMRVPDEMSEVLDRVMLMVDKNENRLILESKDGRMVTLSTKAQERGAAQDSFQLEVGQPFRVFLKASSLKQVLKRMKPELIDFGDILHGQQRMLRFRKNGCQHCMALATE